MNENIYRILNHRHRTPVVVGVGAFVVGGIVGYFVGQRQARREMVAYELNAEYPQMTFDWTKLAPGNDLVTTMPEPEAEIERVERIIPSSAQKPEISDPEVVVDIMNENASDEPVGPEIVRQSVFTDEAQAGFAAAGEGWDYEVERLRRNSTEPYVLHRDEFFDNDTEYAQVTLTYYAGDDILADENGAPVYNRERVIGELRFGHGSDDPNVFYVRNARRRCEYEVVHDDGLYSVEVEGLDIEDNQRAKDLKHSNGPPKFRPD